MQRRARSCLPFLLASVFSPLASADPPLATITPADVARPSKDWLLGPPAATSRVLRGSHPDEIVLTNGLVGRTFRLGPNAATVALDNLSNGQGELRSVRPEAVVTIEGERFDVGGLRGQPIHNYLLPEWLDRMTADPFAFRFDRFEVGPTRERLSWKPRRPWISDDRPWPPPGVALTLDFRATPEMVKAAKSVALREALADVTVRVHYEIYDGVPVVCKWLSVANGSGRPLRLDSFTCEVLAVTERESMVETTPFAEYRPGLRMLHVESDMAFGGRMNAAGDNPAVRWKTDPLYTTQVDFNLQTPCLLECAPPLGPDAVIGPGGTFESFRVFELLFDSTDRERRGLALRRMYRTIAPWTAENPILMHVRNSDPAAVRLAVDQCAEVGFEMVIMTFGSGFNPEDADPSYAEKVKELADYAHAKGIALGGYSLLASRGAGADNDVVNPATGKPGGFARFGNSPCLGSRWGQEYFRKLETFYDRTGLDILEHDGSYPGDVCASTTHPGHRGLADSQWSQWRTIAGWYGRCRSRGVYLNVPDWYFLAGSNKCGMGYREGNWSLPRAQQEVIERQNVFDGTWAKNASMGWMFVPLTEYHGGGPPATIEPLREHLDHYEVRLANLFGAGVQACYRGPRLFDSEATKAVVKRWVDWYRVYRPLLDSDLIHGRRADGRDVDWIAHVRPRGTQRALVMVYNPLAVEAERTLTVPLYYTGLSGSALVREQEGPSSRRELGRDGSLTLTVTVPARGRTWLVVEEPPG